MSVACAIGHCLMDVILASALRLTAPQSSPLQDEDENDTDLVGCSHIRTGQGEL